MSIDSVFNAIIGGAIDLFKATLATIRRIKIRLLILTAIWALYVYITSWNAFVHDASNPALRTLDLWACGSALLLGFIWMNPAKWMNGKRLVIGCTALGLMLGWPSANFAITFGFWRFQPSLAYYLFYAPALEILCGWAVILATGFVALTLFGIFVAIPLSLFNQIFAFEHALNVYRYQARGLAGYIVRFMYWLRNERPPSAGPNDSKGARFATINEIAALHKPNAPEAMAFGHITNPVFFKTDKHVLIMASTRSGKGVTLIIPHLLRYQGSIFCLDPKGENARATGRQRAALNQKVHYLDPFGISGKPKSRFNPLSRFTPDNMEAESKALAAAMFVKNEERSDHWTAAGQQLLAAFILYVYVSPDIPKDKKDLPTVRRLLLGAVKDTLNAMVLIDDADGLLRDLAVSFLETPEKEFGSIVSTAQRQTEILDNPYIVACLSATGPGAEVDFKQWHKGTMSVFLCLSAPKFPTFNRWLRLVLTSALDEMTDALDPPPLPVCFMLDELATLGHLASVENAVGLAAGYGIQLVCVWQDTAQMRDLYKGRWASFIGNSGVRALFNLDDFDTAEYWSKFVGGRLVETRSQQQDLYGYSQGDNVSEAMRPLIAPEQMMMDYAAGKMLVLAQGAHPIVTDRVAYFADKYLAGLWDDPRTPGAAARPAAPAPKPPTPATPPQAPPPAAAAPKPPTSPTPNWPQSVGGIASNWNQPTIQRYGPKR